MNQRRLFADLLLEKMKQNDKIYLLVGDLGYKVWDEHFKQFPERCINVGAAEQTLLDISCGLVLEGKIPFVYSITPFLIYRPFETLRTYVNHEKINVKLIGAGRDDDYKHDGISHDATDVKKVLDTLPNIVQAYPETDEDVTDVLEVSLISNQPYFISLRR